MIVHRSYIPVTRVCVAKINSGVPVGAQIAWLLNTTSGCPFDSTRVDPTIHCAVRQGPLAAGGFSHACCVGSPRR